MNPVTGKPSTGSGYAPATVVHSETVLRRFYDVHRDAGTGPLLNPFPLDLSRRSGLAHAHHNPEAWFNKLFAALPSNRDWALDNGGYFEADWPS
ncbi:hypothetical protein AB0N12_33940 [Streptomyces albogriseolus]|uniref:hypothetical protein n=1 Tax=Streptomyces albogriseolus TaxID=1887 RepID=UPI0034613CC1